MAADAVLDGLLVVSIVLAAGLLLVAMAALGRKIADWELLTERGIDGVPRIQALINIRSQVGNVLLGVLFLAINILLLADAPMAVRQWVNRTAWTLLLALMLVHAVMDWLAEREQVRLLIGQQPSSINSYRQMAAEAVANLEAVAAQSQQQAGITQPDVLAPVVPEHSSPVTEDQRQTADIATMRARLVAANLALGIPPEAGAIDAAADQTQHAADMVDALRPPPGAERGI